MRVTVAQHNTLGVAGCSRSVVDGDGVIRSRWVHRQWLLLAQRFDVADVVDGHTQLTSQRVQKVALGLTRELTSGQGVEDDDDLKSG
jgi:hypothetical protein